MIIDIHTHVIKLPDTSLKESYEKNRNSLIEQMDKEKIDKTFIVAGFRKEDDGFNITTKALIDLIAEHRNLYAIGSMDATDIVREDIDQVEKWLKERLILGIKIYSGYQHIYPSSKTLIPVYELALKYDAPIMFHSGDTLAGYVANPKLKYSHPLQIDDVAADHPNLKIIIAHAGNPWFTDCAEVLYKNTNVFADISGLIIGDDLRTPYGGMMRQKIEEFITYVGSDEKLLYGTDWPLCPMKTYLDFAKNLPLSSKGFDHLFYKNAAHLFKLND